VKPHGAPEAHTTIGVEEPVDPVTGPTGEELDPLDELGVGMPVLMGGEYV